MDKKIPSIKTLRIDLLSFKAMNFQQSPQYATFIIFAAKITFILTSTPRNAASTQLCLCNEQSIHDRQWNRLVNPY
ncbi:hypothetical protein BH10CHL1_BH10CHL1_36160 [soil metagenome]